MGQHESLAARRRRIFQSSSLVALGVAVAAIACGNLQSETGTMGDNTGGGQASAGSGSGSGRARDVELSVDELLRQS